MLVRLKEQTNIVTPPLTMVCYAAADLYPFVARLAHGRIDVRVAWNEIRTIMRVLLKESYKESYQDSQVVCDETTNYPSLVEERKVRFLLSIKAEPRPDFYASYFTLSHTTGVLEVEEQRMSS